MVIDVKGYGEDWRVRPESVQVEEQIALALPSNQVIIQNDSIGSTQVILHDDNAGSRRNREQLLVVEPTADALSGGCQGMVIPDACGLSNFEKSVPNFKETLQQLDKDISKDYVPPKRIRNIWFLRMFCWIVQVSIKLEMIWILMLSWISFLRMWEL